MGAVRLLVTGVYDTMCDCFFYRVIIDVILCFAGVFQRFCVNLYKEYSYLNLNELEKLPHFQVMTWQPYLFLHLAVICFQVTLSHMPK